MIDELAAFIDRNGGNSSLVRSESENGALLQAASYGFNELTKPQVGEFIRQSCRYGSAQPNDIHRHLVTLGPRCFITTNYDNLLEESLRTWQPDRFYPPAVTNRNLTEIGEILHARAIDFVFKPHGDASDSESIILTREQYRQLMPQGERYGALEALKTLMVSRPIVYVGFGLRDPDFGYLQDLLGNTFKGAIRDHFAILPDVTSAEIDYWRKNYGVHIISYATATRSDGTKDHSSILHLLEDLKPKPTDVRASPEFNPNSADVLLALARYSASLERQPKAQRELPLRVNAVARRSRRHRHDFNKFDFSPVETFLNGALGKSALIGLPGAGKSYALRRAAARISESLHTACLKDGAEGLTIPILVDLKLYQGDLMDLVSKTLPASLPLMLIKEHFTLRIFIDSFNEMPREYWEKATYEADFSKFLEDIAPASVIIGSRTEDGLDKFELESYVLDEIDWRTVDAELEKHAEFHGRFESEFRALLSKPYYFHLLSEKAISLPPEPHPRDVYHSLLSNLNNEFLQRFGFDIGLLPRLSAVAFSSIDKGEEAFPLANLLAALSSGEGEGTSLSHARDIANWLVSRNFLVAYSGSRIAFVHQSLTEFLAATELARQYLTNPSILREKLALTRWDQALFLALSLLPPKEANSFYEDVAATDFCLAMNAAKYLETGRTEIVDRILRDVPEAAKRFDFFESRIEWLLKENLPIVSSQEPALRAILAEGNALGGAAAARLIELLGVESKHEFLKLMLTTGGDYNMCCNGIAPALKPFATNDDIRLVFDMAQSITGSDDETQGFTSGAANFLSELDLAVVAEVFLPPGIAPVSDVSARILGNILWSHHTTEALNIAARMLELNATGASTSICFIARHAPEKVELSWAEFGPIHLDRLISRIENGHWEDWALSALELICSNRKDLAKIIADRSVSFRPVLRFALQCASSLDPPDLAFSRIDSLVELIKDDASEFTQVLSQLNIDWTGQEELLVRLLHLRDPELATHLIDQAANADCPLELLDVGPVEWWLDWLGADDGFIFKERISSLFSRYVSPQIRGQLLDEFNRPGSKYRKDLANTILSGFTDISTDDFSAEAISFLMADLTRKEFSSSYRGTLLGNSATERFVQERLVPMFAETNGHAAKNLRSILRQAGRRHGRRYLPD